LQKFVPVLLKLLDGPPVFVSTSPEQVSDLIMFPLILAQQDREVG